MIAVIGEIIAVIILIPFGKWLGNKIVDADNKLDAERHKTH